MDYSHGVLKSMCSPFFPQLRKQLGPYLIEKTMLIENIVNNGLNGSVDLVLRPRRCGKTTMLLMLNSFFCVHREGPDPQQLFNGLHIAKNADICKKHIGKHAVIFCDFKNITGSSWDEMFSSFRSMVSELYLHWSEYLDPVLRPLEKEFFGSICSNATNSSGDWRNSLTRLTKFLARKSKQRVMVFIDEYEAPINHAFEHDFFDKIQANEFFGCGVLPPLLKTNDSIEYAILVGVTPAMKAGRYSHLNNIKTHALHEPDSLFAGMLMFTEAEVLSLRKLSKCKLEPEDLKAHYGSYLAAGHISVYNPVSIMSAFEKSMIENFWVATGKYPLLHRKFPDNGLPLDVIKRLLSGSDISFKLEDDVSLSMLFSSILHKNGALTLLYYAGYLTMTPTNLFKIPNREVMMDWARWIIGRCIQSNDNVLNICVEGHVSIFEERWPNFMQQHLDPKIVTRVQGVSPMMTPEEIYHVYFLSFMHIFQPKGWELSIEPRARGGYVDIRLISRKKDRAVLVELKSSEKPEDMESDARKALKQMADKNYRNQGLPTNIHILREYGMASYRLTSCVKGRYLERDTQSRWVEKDDPAMRI